MSISRIASQNKVYIFPVDSATSKSICPNGDSRTKVSRYLPIRS
jgi:hypothetical protein